MQGKSGIKEPVIHSDLAGRTACPPGTNSALWTSFLYTRDIASRWCCWSRRPRKSKGLGDLGRICRCAFVGDWGEMCFQLPWWGKENERFGKRLYVSILIFKSKLTVHKNKKYSHLLIATFFI